MIKNFILNGGVFMSQNDENNHLLEEKYAMLSKIVDIAGIKLCDFKKTNSYHKHPCSSICIICHASIF